MKRWGWKMEEQSIDTIKKSLNSIVIYKWKAIHAGPCVYHIQHMPTVHSMMMMTISRLTVTDVSKVTKSYTEV